jgi:hypothetical protein
MIPVSRDQASPSLAKNRSSQIQPDDGCPQRSRQWSLAGLLCTLLLLAGCGDQAGDGQTKSGLTEAELAIESPDGSARELSWDDLIPADWQPEALMEEYDADNLSDDDPRANELMDKLRALWAEAPVVEALDQRLVRLPGFVVPLEINADRIREFLLVPYFGACIHVPPPPANQTILVTTPEEQPYVGALFDTVWVEGRLRVEPFSNELGDAGYRIEQAAVSLYEEL